MAVNMAIQCPLFVLGMNLKGGQFMLHLLNLIYLTNNTFLLEGFLIFSVVSLYANVG